MTQNGIFTLARKMTSFHQSESIRVRPWKTSTQYRLNLLVRKLSSLAYPPSPSSKIRSFFAPKSADVGIWRTPFSENVRMDNPPDCGRIFKQV